MTLVLSMVKELWRVMVVELRSVDSFGILEDMVNPNDRFDVTNNT